MFSALVGDDTFTDVPSSCHGSTYQLTMVVMVLCRLDLDLLRVSSLF